MARAADLFQTIPSRDLFGLWTNETLNARRVVAFLGFDKREIAKMSGVAAASVRFDHKMPKEVLDRLEQIATIIGLVAQYFEGDVVKTSLWFKTKNPLLGYLAPREMIRLGRQEKVQRFVMEGIRQSADRRATTAATGIDHPLIAAHRIEIERLCRHYGVKRLAVFGSILSQDFDAASSDVDFVVEFGPAENLSPARQYFDFQAALETLLGRPVDLVELKAMSESRLKRIIQRTQVPVYGEAA